MRGFLKRWPELRVLKPRSLENNRAKLTSKATVDKYFENLERCLSKHGLTDKPHLIFNLDEKGITTEHKLPYIVGTPSCCPPAVTSGRGKTITILGCISASGIALPLFFVSSPEHKVLMVSFCDRPMSGVRRPSCVVRRPSCVVHNLFKHLLLLNHWANLDETWQGCFLGEALPKLFKRLNSNHNSGCHGNQKEKKK